MKEQPNKEIYLQKRPHGGDTTWKGHYTEEYYTEEILYKWDIYVKEICTYMEETYIQYRKDIHMEKTDIHTKRIWIYTRRDLHIEEI